MQFSHIISRIDSEKPTGATIIAQEGAAIVGVLTMSLNEPAGFVRSLYVADPHRERGIGRQLLSRAIMLSEQHGRTGLGLSVKDTNDTAQRLYRSMGFVPHAQDYEGYTQYLLLSITRPQ